MYQLDAQSAREAENFSSFLSETGKYQGAFKRAEKLVSKKKGTHGIGFTFESDSKQSTRFDIWTMSANGDHLSGFKAINAIMACMKVRSITPKQGKVEKRDWETKQTSMVDAEVFPDLVGKPIGLVLQSVEYEKMRDGQKTGETGWRLELVAPFEAATEFTAAEILDRATSPAKLGSIVASLQDRPLKNKPVARQQSNDFEAGNAAAQRASSGFSDMEDDCPF